jgi:hypothetical protein
MSMTRREKRNLKALAFSILAFWGWSWGLMIEVGVLHSWWPLIPVMSASVAGAVVIVAFVVAASLWLLKLFLLED